MSKKIMLLALAAVTAAMFALPAAAAADSLHITPAPSAGDKTIHGVGGATLTTTDGTTVTCAGFKGTANFESGTTGTMQLTFGGDCTGPFGSTCTSNTPAESSGNIQTTVLPFHLVTLKGKLPGVLVTPSTDGAFAHFICGGFISVTVTGNGVLGTITSPSCEGESSTATVSFGQSAAGVQNHTELENTAGVWRLKKGEAFAAQNAHGTLTLGSTSKLVCT
jgi:hypothetical protein